MGKKEVAPPKPWRVAPFIECFAFVGGHMLTGHALDNQVREWDLDVGLVLKEWRKGRKNKDCVDEIAVRPSFSLGARQRRTGARNRERRDALARVARRSACRGG